MTAPTQLPQAIMIPCDTEELIWIATALAMMGAQMQCDTAKQLVILAGATTLDYEALRRIGMRASALLDSVLPADA